MRAYITAVAAVAIMAGFADNFVPLKWQKYISLLTGAILLLVLITPLLNLRKIEIPKLSISEDDYINYDIANEVEADLTKRIEEDINAKLFDEFGINASAEVKLKIEDDTICGVEKITLDCTEKSDITAMLKELYGCDNIQY